MDSSDTMQQLVELLGNKFGFDTVEITPQMTLQNDLGADSFDLVEVRIEVEETFGIKIYEEDIATLFTIEDIATYIDNMQ